MFEDLRAALLAADFAAEPHGFGRVTGGMDNELWRFATPDGAEHVLRLYRTGNDAALEHERLGMAAAAAGGVPVPRFEAAGSWQGRALAVQPWLPGVPLTEALRMPQHLAHLGRALGAMQAAIHAVTAPAKLHYGRPDWWIDLPGPEHAPIAAAVRRLSLRADALVHLDYHPLNVLVQGADVTAVLDWVSAAAADQRADLARTAMFLTVPPLPAGMPRPLVRAALAVLRRAWWRGYCAAAGPQRIPPALAAWAGAWLLHDLEQRLGEPGNWTDERDLAALRRWVATWSARAGVTA
jgi:Ser/Thr protein kinase RdoA (MazF antagonist)